MELTLKELRETLDAFEIEHNAILLTHSSLKALGQIEGGAETVIRAIEETVPQGTVVFPTLSQKNFETAFEDWSLDRPSDVGLITETFRKQSGSLRSDNPTHSVAARGKHAYDLVADHAKGKGRYGVFGDLCFGWESPWQRMFDSRERYGVRAYVLFWGVSPLYNTFKHFAEYRLAERLLNHIDDEDRRRGLRDLLLHKPPIPHPQGKEQLWLFFSMPKLESLLFDAGLARKLPLGNGHLILCDIFEMTEFTEEILWNAPEKIIESKEALAWIKEAKASAKKSSSLS